MIRMRIKPTHEAADAFWKHWNENDGRHGYYESTWGAINAALNSIGQDDPLILGKAAKYGADAIRDILDELRKTSPGNEQEMRGGSIEMERYAEALEAFAARIGCSS